MKKTIQLIIIVCAFLGMLINVLVSTYELPVNLGRGLGLFRYYTLQSNLIVCTYFILEYLGHTKKSKTLKNFLGGVTVYITITLVVFAIMLQGTYHPTGWNRVSNILAHYLVPILVIIYTWLYRKDYSFDKKDSLMWILYPLIYVVFMIIFGTITGDYLYPFFQVQEVGILAFIITVFILVLFFFGLSFLLMKIVSLGQKSKS